LLLQLAIFIVAIPVSDVILGLIGPLVVYLIYLAWLFGSLNILARHQMAGIRYYKRRKWSEALARFQRSQAFFEQHPWIDRYRQVILMLPSAISFHEMALINQGNCLIHLNRGLEARRAVERARA
jgi:hypothetical protein